MTPGEDWVMPPDDRVTWLAERLRAAHDRFRRWGGAVGLIVDGTCRGRW